jgi:hypothetical protein
LISVFPSQLLQLSHRARLPIVADPSNDRIGPRCVAATRRHMTMPLANLSRALQREVERLQNENTDLRNRLAFFQQHPTLAMGLRGESIVTKLLRGTTVAGNAPYDVVAKGGCRIEVKCSGLNTPVRGRDTRRWVWTKLFGESGRKKYDRLLLVGLPDQRFSSRYKDVGAPFVLFDIPNVRIRELAVPVQGGRYTAIFLTTNPLATRSVRSSKLFGKYQVTVSELRTRYGL